MSNKRALWGLIPAAILCSVLLVGLEQSGRQSSAPAPDVTVNPSGATVVSRPASAPSETAEARVDEKAGNGGDGGTPVVATPASTTVVSSALVTVEPTKESATDLYQEPTPIMRASSQVPLRSAIEAAFPPSEVETAYRVAMCESGGDADAPTGAAGERGAWQIIERFHGTVPDGIYAQAVHAAQVQAINGWGIWSCS